MLGQKTSIGMLGNDSLMLFPPVRIVVSDAAGAPLLFYPFEMKGKHRKQLVCPADVDVATADTVAVYAHKLWHACGICDYCQGDLKLDAHGNPSFLKMNALPGLDPNHSLYPAAGIAAGTLYDQLIASILRAPVSRQATASS